MTDLMKKALEEYVLTLRTAGLKNLAQKLVDDCAANGVVLDV